MRTFSLTDMEPTLPAPPPTPSRPRGFTRTQWVLAAAQLGAPLLFALAVTVLSPERTGAFFESEVGLFALAALAGALLAGELALLGLFVLVNRAAPRGRSSHGFRALCHTLALAMTSVLFTAPVCLCLAYAPTVVELLKA